MAISCEWDASDTGYLTTGGATNISGTTGWLAISLWYYLEIFRQDQQICQLDDDDGNYAFRFRCGVGAANGNLRVHMRRTEDPWNVYWDSDGAEVTEETWHHLAFKFRIATGASFVMYRDGSEVNGSFTGGDGDEAGDQPIYPMTIGQAGFQRNFRVHDMAVWANSGATDPLLEAHMAAIYDARLRANVFQNEYMIEYWPFHFPISGALNAADIGLRSSGINATTMVYGGGNVNNVEPGHNLTWPSHPMTFIPVAAGATGKPTMRYWGGVPGMPLTGRVGW